MASARQERRNELARAAGFRNYHEQRNASARSKGYANYAAQRAARAAGTTTAADTPQNRRRQIHRTPAGTIVTTTKRGKGWTAVEAELRRMGSAKVAALVTWWGDDGETHETRLWDHGGISAAVVAAGLADEGPDWLAGQIDLIGGGTDAPDVSPSEGPDGSPSVQWVQFREIR